MISLIGQKLVDIEPSVKCSYQGDFKPTEEFKNEFVSKLIVPFNANQPVGITINGNNNASVDDIYHIILQSLDTTVNTSAETECEELFKQTITNYKKGLPANKVFVAQAMVKTGNPLPAPNVIYNTSSDVIPACRDYIAGKGSNDMLLAAFGGTFKPDTVGLFFTDERQFDIWMSDLMQQYNIIQQMAGASMTDEVRNKFSQFGTIKLNDLTEKIILRTEMQSDDDEFSFSRVLMYIIDKLTVTYDNILPFSLHQMFAPDSLTFINLMKHATERPKTINNEWFMNENFRPKTFNKKSLMKASAIKRAAAASKSFASGGSEVMRYAFAPIKALNTKQTLTKRIRRIVAKLGDVIMSNNTYKSEKMTYSRPNRRHPDDYNKQGKIKITKYRPDIHLYIDTSQSISEDMYRWAVSAAVDMAMKENIDVYFTSFSHILSETTKLHIKGRSKKAIMKEFERIPKVSGGTDFKLVWDYISSNKKRQNELAILMTDFEWSPPSDYPNYPKNLYYAPVDNGRDARMISAINEFGKNMIYIEPAIQAKILA